MCPGPLPCLLGMALMDQNIPRPSTSRCLICFLQQQQATATGSQQARLLLLLLLLPTTGLMPESFMRARRTPYLQTPCWQQAKQSRAATEHVLERA